MSEKVMKKIEEISYKIIDQAKDKTILFTEDTILNFDKFFEAIKKSGIVCEKGLPELKEFYYLLPKCRYQNIPLIAIAIAYPGVVYRYTDNDKELFRKSIEETLAIHVMAKSRTFYQLYINALLDDKTKNFFILPENEYWLMAEAMKMPQFDVVMKGDRIDIRKINELYIIAYEPANPQVPKYSFMKVHKELEGMKLGVTFELIPLDKETLVKMLDEYYEMTKEEYEKIINSNKEFKKMIEEILEGEM